MGVAGLGINAAEARLDLGHPCLRPSHQQGPGPSQWVPGGTWATSHSHSAGHLAWGPSAPFSHSLPSHCPYGPLPRAGLSS